MSEEVDNQKKSELLKQLEEDAAIKEKQQAIANSEKAIAEAEKAIAVAKKAKLEAELPVKPNTEQPKGTTIATDDKFGYLAELVAYDALTNQAKELVKEIYGEIANNDKILLVGDQYMETGDVRIGDVQMLQVKIQMEALNEGLNDQIEANKEYLDESEKETKEAEKRIVKMPISPLSPVFAVAPAILAAAPAILAAAPAVVDSLAYFADMFRKDYTIKGKEIALSNIALCTLIIKELNEEQKHDGGKNYSVYLPHLCHITESNLIETFENLVKQRLELQNQVHQLRQQIVEPKKKMVAELEEKIKTLAGSSLVEINNLLGEMQVKLKNLKEKLQKADTAILQSESLIIIYDQSMKALMAAAEGQNSSPLEAAILREKISALGITHLLYVKNVSGGGEAITIKENLISANTAYLGGSVVSYILTKVDGHIVAAGTLVKAKRLDYKLASKIGACSWSELK